MQEQKLDVKDAGYSAWHRRKSTRRYVGIEKAQLLAMIDLDAALYVEYDDGTKEPLAIIETAMDVGQPYKPATVSANLARMADLPCYVVLYKLSDERNPADENFYDISEFRVQRWWPKKEQDWRVLTPKEWSEALLAMRGWKAHRLDKGE